MGRTLGAAASGRRVQAKNNEAHYWNPPLGSAYLKAWSCALFKSWLSN